MTTYSWKFGETPLGNPCCQSCGIVQEKTNVCFDCLDIAKNIIDLGLWRDKKSYSKTYREWVKGWSLAIYVLEKQGNVPLGTYRSNRSGLRIANIVLERRLRGLRHRGGSPVSHSKTLSEVFESDRESGGGAIPDYLCGERLPDVEGFQSDVGWSKDEICRTG